jgi:tetratricopeptide (TPR) repeat protein
VDPLVGTTVAHYDVVARLGGGGMGIVYAARDTKLGRRVALKFLPPQWSHDESAKQRFIREAQAASATDHPNICTIHDIASTDDGQLFIVMAHYDGETLKSRLERGRLTVDEAVEIAAQVAEGLAKAHNQGVVHRDIKPGNLMLTENGVKILDFGLAKFADARWKLTLEGSTIGTVAYMSPEQARGEEADARSDVWAVGVVLYEMLTGGVPFKGGYPEAISHAIKNDSPAPIRAAVAEVSETLEQLVFRALHKDPAVRMQSARDLARSLRLIQGRTLPIDLRTEPLPVISPPRAAVSTRPRRWRSRKTAGIAAAIAAVMLGAPLWVFSPVEPTSIAIAPVVNQTGYAELDSYRMALTRELVAQLRDSRPLRVLPYERLLQIVRRFRVNGEDVSGREAMALLAKDGSMAVIAVPTLVNEGGNWLVRVDIRDPTTALTTASLETASVVSSLPKEALYALIPAAAQRVEDHFITIGPRRGYWAERVRQLTGLSDATRAPSLRTLDAAAALERGEEAFLQQEYAAALAAFTAATEQDPRSPVALAWRSQAARMLRRDRESFDDAEAAERLLRAGTPAHDRLLVEATAAEARGDAEAAEARHAALVERTPGDAYALSRLAAFLERQGRAPDAIAANHRALEADAGALRPHVDLCRLYNPRELATARRHGSIALDGYRTLGDRAGEAHARWCLVDVLRLGTAAERAEGRRHAAAALQIFQNLDYPYSRARAHNYVALAAFADGDLVEAGAAWDRALAGAQAVGNRLLEPLVLMNLGLVAHRLGQRARQLDYLNRSASLFEALGQQQRAAEVEANAAAVLIEYAGQPEEGLRRLQNAAQVARKLGNTNFEALAGQVTGSHHLLGGRLGDAEREFNRALSLARERDFQDRIQTLTAFLARVRVEAGDYAGARALLGNDANSPSVASTTTDIHLLRARIHVRIGDFDAARNR